MQILTQITTILVVYWPALLALGAFTTALAQFAKALAAKFPKLAPVATFIAHLSVDFIEALKVIAKLIKKDPPEDGSDGGDGGATIKRISLGTAIAFALLLTGCGGKFEEARDARVMLGPQAPTRDSTHCQSLDDQHVLFTDFAWGEGSLAGASGAVAGALPSDTPKGWRIGLGAAAVGFAAATVYSVAHANDVANEWVRDCSAVTPAVTQ